MNRFVVFAAFAAIFLIAQGSDLDDVVQVVVQHEGEDRNQDFSICLTQRQVNMVELLRKIQEDLSGDEFVTADCDGEEVQQIILTQQFHLAPIRQENTENVKKALLFLKNYLGSTYDASQEHELPKPLNSKFAEMKINLKKEYEADKATEKQRIETERAIKDLEGEEREKAIAAKLKTWEQANKNADRYYRVLSQDIINFFQFTLEPTENAEDRSTKIEEDKATCEANQGKYCMVAGPYGTNNLENGGDQDCYLNEVFAAGQNDQNKVNNPRELLKLIDTADALNFQNLLDLAAAKFASSIRRNDLYRLRAIYGFSPNGDYTEFTYTIKKPAKENKIEDEETEEIKGMANLLHENTWFNPLNANEEYRRNAAGENANNAACTCAVNHDYTPESDAARAYNDYPTGYIKYTDTDKNDVYANQMYY